MIQLRKKNSPPTLVLAVIPSNEDPESFGIPIPGDEMSALSLIDCALLAYQISQANDLTPEAKKRKHSASQIRGAIKETTHLLARRRRDHYQALVLGTSVRVDSLTDTIKLSDERRSYGESDVQLMPRRNSNGRRRKV